MQELGGAACVSGMSDGQLARVGDGAATTAPPITDCKVAVAAIHSLTHSIIDLTLSTACRTNLAGINCPLQDAPSENICCAAARMGYMGYAIPFTCFHLVPVRRGRRPRRSASPRHAHTSLFPPLSHATPGLHHRQHHRP